VQAEHFFTAVGADASRTQLFVGVSSAESATGGIAGVFRLIPFNEGIQSPAVISCTRMCFPFYFGFLNSFCNFTFVRSGQLAAGPDRVLGDQRDGQRQPFALGFRYCFGFDVSLGQSHCLCCGQHVAFGMIARLTCAHQEIHSLSRETQAGNIGAKWQRKRNRSKL
jgi:hypothetical protein